MTIAWRDWNKYKSFLLDCGIWRTLLLLMIDSTELLNWQDFFFVPALTFCQTKQKQSKYLTTNNVVRFCIGVCISFSLLLFLLLLLFSPQEFFSSALTDGLSRWSDSKSPQVSRTLLSILAVLNDAVLLMVPTRPPTTKSSSPFINPLVTVPITIGVIVNFMFHSFFQFSSKVEVVILLFTFFQFYSVVSRVIIIIIIIINKKKRFYNKFSQIHIYIVSPIKNIKPHSS